MISRIDARHGACGIVPKELDGLLVTNDFPAFDVNASLLDLDFLRWLSRSPWFVDQCVRASEGTTNRVRLSMPRFLALEIPVPDLTTQRARAAWLGAMAKKTQEMSDRLSASRQGLPKAVLAAVTEARRTEWPDLPLGEVVDILDSARVPVSLSERASRQGDVPYYGAGGQVGWIDEPMFDEQLLLLAEDAGPFNTRCGYLVKGPSWVNNHAHVLRGTAVTNEWLLWMLRTMDLRPYLSGSTRPKLTRGALVKIPIPTPSMDVQRHLGSAWMAATTRTSEARQLIERSSQAAAKLLPTFLTEVFAPA